MSTPSFSGASWASAEASEVMTCFARAHAPAARRRQVSLQHVYSADNAGAFPVRRESRARFD
jgi:hypothetical protein